MNSIFNSIPLPALSSASEYDCGRDSYMLKYTPCTKADFDAYCEKVTAAGFVLHSAWDIRNNYHKTFIGQILLHIYYCESEKTLRVVADPNTTLFQPSELPCPRTHQTTLWQFEVDHALIDCGMCYIVRCCDGSFFVIDSAHPYSVNDDIRLCDFLWKLNGGRKPTVAGWFISHGHEDHTGKAMDIIEYSADRLDIKTVYYNFPSFNHRDSHLWGKAHENFNRRFERLMDSRPDIKKIRLHTGQRFFVGNLQFEVLCTHEDVFPNSCHDFNNTSTALLMTAEGSKVLFPGDCSAESDKVLVRRYGDYIKCDVVQISHHGHSGTSPQFYRNAAAECALFPITVIKYDEEWPRQESNRVAVEIAKEFHIASNGTVEIPLPYVYGNTKVHPDETFEDFNGIFNLWTYEYTDERKEQLRREFEERSKK